MAGNTMQQPSRLKDLAAGNMATRTLSRVHSLVPSMENETHKLCVQVVGDTVHPDRVPEDPLEQLGQRVAWAARLAMATEGGRSHAAHRRPEQQQTENRQPHKGPSGRDRWRGRGQRETERERGGGWRRRERERCERDNQANLNLNRHYHTKSIQNCLHIAPPTFKTIQ